MQLDFPAPIHMVSITKSSSFWADELQKFTPLSRLEHRLPGHSIHRGGRECHWLLPQSGETL